MPMAGDLYVPGGEGATRMRAAVVDDSPAFVTAAGVWLGPSWDWRSYSNIEKLLSDSSLAVNVILLDLGLNDARSREGAGLLAGIRGVREVAALGFPVLVWTIEARPFVLAAALAAGAKGILHKSESIDVQVQAIRTAAAGGSVISPAVANAVRQVLDRKSARLTDRQRDVLVMRVRGRTWAHIAKHLGISVDAARGHERAALKKFQDVFADRSLAEIVRELGVAPGDNADRA